jgi:sialate O-acetylesterase
MAFGLGSDEQGATWTVQTIPELHYVLVPRKTGIPVERDFTPQELAWKSFTPGQNAALSAVSFYFAKEIKDATGRQVGIIQSAAAGTPIQAWTPITVLDAHPQLKHFADSIRAGIARGRGKEECLAEVEADHQWYLANREWQKTKEGSQPVRPEVKDGNPWFHRSPTVLYKNMIEPLTQYTVRGILWYQGENNTGNPPEYQVMFPAMIQSWRSAWIRPDLPFYFVQLPAWNSTAPWAEFRAAQAVARETLDHVGMAVAIDCGEKDNIHPKNKQPVGDRLARLALADVYGLPVVSRGPVFQTLEKIGDRIRVVFQCSENGLKTSDGKADVPGFEVAGADGAFHVAAAHIVGKDTVELISSEVREPESVRYAWHSWIEPPVTLRNSVGLPAEPFCN